MFLIRTFNVESRNLKKQNKTYQEVIAIDMTLAPTLHLHAVACLFLSAVLFGLRVLILKTSHV
jgi:hypothetical protein